MCPLTGDNCMKHDCEWYIQVMGTNPNTGQDVDRWGCSISFIPMLLIENSQQQRQTGAAVESFRNVIADFIPMIGHKKEKSPELIRDNHD